MKYVYDDPIYSAQSQLIGKSGEWIARCNQKDVDLATRLARKFDNLSEPQKDRIRQIVDNYKKKTKGN